MSTIRLRPINFDTPKRYWTVMYCLKERDTEFTISFWAELDREYKEWFMTRGSKPGWLGDLPAETLQRRLFQWSDELKEEWDGESETMLERLAECVGYVGAGSMQLPSSFKVDPSPALLKGLLQGGLERRSVGWLRSAVLSAIEIEESEATGYWLEETARILGARDPEEPLSSDDHYRFRFLDPPTASASFVECKLTYTCVRCVARPYFSSRHGRRKTRQ